MKNILFPKTKYVLCPDCKGDHNSDDSRWECFTCKYIKYENGNNIYNSKRGFLPKWYVDDLFKKRQEHKSIFDLKNDIQHIINEIAYKYDVSKLIEIKSFIQSL